MQVKIEADILNFNDTQLSMALHDIFISDSDILVVEL